MITAVVYQTQTEARLEKTAWDVGNGGGLTEANFKQIITTGGSGVLRFRSQDEYLSPSVWTDNNRWVDVVTNLTPNDTAVHVHSDYYGAGSEHTPVREKHFSSFNVTSSHART